MSNIQNNINVDTDTVLDITQLQSNATPVICLTTIKNMLDQTENTVPFTSTFHLRYGHIRLIRVTPPRIKIKQNYMTDKESNILKAKQHDSATSKKQLN